MYGSNAHARTATFNTTKGKGLTAYTREGMVFGSNCVLKGVGFGLKFVLKRVRVP